MANRILKYEDAEYQAILEKVQAKRNKLFENYTTGEEFARENDKLDVVAELLKAQSDLSYKLGGIDVFFELWRELLDGCPHCSPYKPKRECTRCCHEIQDRYLSQEEQKENA